MREIRFKSDYWQSLAPLSFRLRGLYTVLCCSCDHAGVLVWDAAKIAEDAGGKGFGMDDLRGLADANLIIWLDDSPGEGKRILVVDYLKMQNKTLSLSCRGQAPVRRDMAKHWPGGIEFAWVGMGISDRLPQIKVS